MPAQNDQIVVANACVHNLKGVDLDLPRDSLVVFTGVSGSGKSSLAFDTIYQEGQRRFMESLSSYARQFLGKMERPEVDRVEGLSPTISIDQKTVNRNPRSTVGTVTEIADHMRLLMARLGQAHCPECDTPITAQSPGQIADDILDLPVHTSVILLAPIVQDRKGEYRKELADLREKGWLRARIDGEIRRLDEDIELARYEKHTIEVVLDRIKVQPEVRGRLVEGVERGLAMAKGTLTALVGPDQELRTWSSDRACPQHPGVSIPELEPRLFSFNAPQGACPTCSGLGELVGFDPDRMVDPALPLPQCLKVFNDQGRLPFSGMDHDVIRSLAEHIGADLSLPWDAQPMDVQDAILLGEGVTWSYTRQVDKGQGRVDTRVRQWKGVFQSVRHIYHFTHHKPFEQFRTRVTCPSCQGARLNPIALGVRYRGKNMAELWAMTVRDAAAYFAGIRLKGTEALIGKEVLREIRDRLSFLDQVGLGYLGMGRSATTLSGGEAQRIRLAAQVGSGLQGVTYVLDEPSIGLHPRDNQRLLGTLLRLRDAGNSVLVVEHDRETMEVADWLVDIGPGAGRLGGEIVAQGIPAKLKGQRSSTAAYLRGEQVLPLPDARRPLDQGWITVRGARANNLNDLTVGFPLGVLTVVTGVSGSGKSSLVVHTLQQALKRHFGPANVKVDPGPHDGIDGLDQIDKVIVIDQAPIGRTPRSNPVTYTGAFTHIRKLFTLVPEARARGYKPGRFSFNVVGGRCEDCQGAGVKTIEMQFLADVQVVCETCMGRRFNDETLEIRYRGKTITDVLAMPLSEAAEFFSKHRTLGRILRTLVSVGLGYVQVGQPSTTLSGGEAQRIKLASELQRPSTGKTLYILDEPTTGLHFQDVARLMGALDRLVEGGNSVLVIEHDTEVMKLADHIIDLGPEGGDGGGHVVGHGTPEHIATLDTPTGRVLAELPELGGPPRSFQPRRKRKTRNDGDLVVTGATCHNLKGVDARIPNASLTVITGPSGSGKSSLAFHTIFAEGQRRYVECMSTYARRFLGRLDRAAVEKIEGLAPAIAINQKTASHNPRSTVATVTEIYDYLRLIWARLGVPHCHICAKRIRGYTPSAGARALQEWGGQGWLLAPMAPHAAPAERRSELLKSGFLRVFHDDAEWSLEHAETEAMLKAGCALVVDRVKPETASRSRLAEALQTAYATSGGVAHYRLRSGGVHPLTERPTCPDHGPVGPSELTPRHFSFNSWVGACKTCDGLGRVTGIDPDLLLPKPHLTLWKALDPRVASVIKRSKKQKGRITSVLRSMGLKLADRVNTWTDEQRQTVLYGLDQELTARWTKKWGATRNRVVETFSWEGLIPVIDQWNAELTWLRRDQQCPTCKGLKLQRELLAVTVQGTAITEYVANTVESARSFWDTLELSDGDAQVAEQPLREVRNRLKFLSDVGLGYLTLERAARTLSGGESQRIRLATQLGSGLTGCIYVLDEPTVGLHPRDTQRLLNTLEGLRALGNTVLVVEHDEETMRRADRILDMGPGAGEAGGHLVAEGTPAEIEANPDSLTGAYLSRRKRISRPATVREATKWIELTGAHANNLQDVDARFGIGTLTVVTGVSGSGKSSLVMGCLVPALNAYRSTKAPPAPVAKAKIPGVIKGVTVVNQAPLSGSPRSTPATVCKIMDGLRKLYAASHQAKIRGWAPGRFSYNAAGGRCSHCEGRGHVLVEMHFLSDVWVTCESCRGRRYNDETLEVRWRGATIADVLEMRVSEALEFFSAHRSLRRPLQALHDVGLGYLRLGQSVTTLSGGEAQRVKLARQLAGKAEGQVVVLDEPTTGLHPDDVAKLVTVLQRMADAGATLVVIEHHTDVMHNADQILDMGPEGGAEGGMLVASGTVAHVMTLDTPTARALRDHA